MPDLDCPKGDTQPPAATAAVVKSKSVKNKVKSTGGITKGNNTSSKGCSENCDNCAECEEGSSKISYSVSYFTWSVSDQSSDEETETITITLGKMKLRRTSKERNELMNRNNS